MLHGWSQGDWSRQKYKRGMNESQESSQEAEADLGESRGSLPIGSAQVRVRALCRGI